MGNLNTVIELKLTCSKYL